MIFNLPAALRFEGGILKTEVLRVRAIGTRCDRVDTFSVRAAALLFVGGARCPSVIIVRSLRAPSAAGRRGSAKGDGHQVGAANAT